MYMEHRRTQSVRNRIVSTPRPKRTIGVKVYWKSRIVLQSRNLWLKEIATVGKRSRRTNILTSFSFLLLIFCQESPLAKSNWKSKGMGTLLMLGSWTEHRMKNVKLVCRGKQKVFTGAIHIHYSLLWSTCSRLLPIFILGYLFHIDLYLFFMWTMISIAND